MYFLTVFKVRFLDIYRKLNIIKQTSLFDWFLDTVTRCDLHNYRNSRRVRSPQIAENTADFAASYNRVEITEWIMCVCGCRVYRGVPHWFVCFLFNIFVYIFCAEPLNLIASLIIIWHFADSQRYHRAACKFLLISYYDRTHQFITSGCCLINLLNLVMYLHDLLIYWLIFSWVFLMKTNYSPYAWSPFTWRANSKQWVSLVKAFHTLQIIQLNDQLSLENNAIQLPQCTGSKVHFTTHFEHPRANTTIYLQ